MATRQLYVLFQSRLVSSPPTILPNALSVGVRGGVHIHVLSLGQCEQKTGDQSRLSLILPSSSAPKQRQVDGCLGALEPETTRESRLCLYWLKGSCLSCFSSLPPSSCSMLELGRMGGKIVSMLPFSWCEQKAADHSPLSLIHPGPNT